MISAPTDDTEEGMKEIQEEIVSDYSDVYASGEDHPLHQFCARLVVPRDVEGRAGKILRAVDQADLSDHKMSQMETIACVVFMASVEVRMPYLREDLNEAVEHLLPHSVTVNKILQVADINIKSFFDTINILKDKLLPADSVTNYLISIERNYCVVAALHNTFQTRMCSSVFRNEGRSGDEEYVLPPIPETEGVSFRRKQCWVLFLLAKHYLLKEVKELFPNFQLLVCALEFVLRQTPSFLLHSPYDSFRFESSSATDDSTVLLDHLVSDFDLPLSEQVSYMNKIALPYFQTLLTNDGQLDLDQLCAEYDVIYKKGGGIDEMLFLERDWHLMPLDITSGFDALSIDNDRQKDKQSSPLGSMTPTRAAVSTVQQFMSIVKPMKAEPTKSLLKIFKWCKPDPTELVREQVLALQNAFVNKYKTLMGQKDIYVPCCRYSNAIRLFFKVLESMLEKESKRLSENLLGTLLQKKEFIQSMVAVSCEVTIATFGQSWSQASGSMTSEAAKSKFPWVLEIFDLQAYEFYKVIESFIKAEPLLPAVIVKHLQNVEQYILESLAWKKDSMLFNVMGTWEVGQMTTPTNSPAKSPDKSNSVRAEQNESPAHLFMSPVRQLFPPQGSPVKVEQSASTPISSPSKTESPAKEGSPAHSANSSSDTSTSVRPPARKSQSLSHFLSRVCRLGYCRLSKLCTNLQIAKDVQHKIWTCFEHCVTQMPNLIKNRHIDQILMCCIFGMCKVVGQDVRFKSIVHEYKTMAHARPEIHKHVYINRNKVDSIIVFYNHVFLQNIKPYILQFSPQRPTTPQLSPLPKHAQASPRHSLLGKRKFTVSPMKDSEFKTPASPSQMTPSTRLLYSFGDTIGSSEKLKHINATMMARGSMSAKKKLNLDDMAPLSTPSVPKSSKSLDFSSEPPQPE
ncbi:retinoblastoma-associated protein [Aplysia californica]|uniref:Retinoblastoma-associated protein n=1 Tax=Aplysia californica TaxID=6500 RepID=A0ABM0K1A6_APLCA|nr:retinoblastoma-associated protein [Aplysia californica]